MRKRYILIHWLAPALLALNVVSPRPLQAQAFKAIFEFSRATSGSQPNGSLLLSGNYLYGTTQFGGAADLGVAYQFELSSGKLNVMHSFAGGPSDGEQPLYGLVKDSVGNLYGTTPYGGINGSSNPDSGDGTVFQLAPSGVERVFNFTVSNGEGPYSTLVRDSAGNLFGTTINGGANAGGTVFELGATGTLTTLFNFGDVNGGPSGSFVLVPGAIYGVAAPYEGYPNGIVFKVDLETGVETVIHSFSLEGSAGRSPDGGLVADAAGNLYGTTKYGGTYFAPNCPGTASGCGTLFRIDKAGFLTTLYNFTGGLDGAAPAALTIDAKGDLFGTTSAGGLYPQACQGQTPTGCGTVFKWSAGAGFTTLYSFPGTPDGGGSPYPGLTLGSDGSIYGVTEMGTSGDGMMFELRP